MIINVYILYILLYFPIEMLYRAKPSAEQYMDCPVWKLERLHVVLKM